MPPGEHEDGEREVEELAVPAPSHIRVVLTVQPSGIQLKVKR